MTLRSSTDIPLTPELRVALEEILRPENLQSFFDEHGYSFGRDNSRDTASRASTATNDVFSSSRSLIDYDSTRVSMVTGFAPWSPEPLSLRFDFASTPSLITSTFTLEEKNKMNSWIERREKYLDENTDLERIEEKCSITHDNIYDLVSLDGNKPPFYERHALLSWLLSSPKPLDPVKKGNFKRSCNRYL